VIASILLDGLFLSALLSLASLGLSLSYAVFRFPNFAHGDLITVGAYGAGAGAMLAGGAEAPVASILTATAASVVAAIAVMLLADRIVLQTLLARRQGAAVIIASFAIGLLLRNVVVLLFGPDETAPTRALEIAVPVWNFAPFAAARLTTTERFVIAGTITLIVLVDLLLRRTTLGRDLRAVAENPELAGVCGIVVPRLRVLAWLLAGGCCGIAGLALFLLGPVRPETGAEFMLPTLAAVIVGGVGSIPGTLAGALLIGVAESAAVHLGAAEWRQVISFALIIVVLCVRPAGLFGQRS
jgi:branched-chain amino acid transport system permease protein